MNLSEVLLVSALAGVIVTLSTFTIALIVFRVDAKQLRRSRWFPWPFVPGFITTISHLRLPDAHYAELFVPELLLSIIIFGIGVPLLSGERTRVTLGKKTPPSVSNNDHKSGGPTP